MGMSSPRHEAGQGQAGKGIDRRFIAFPPSLPLRIVLLIFLSEFTRESTV